MRFPVRSGSIALALALFAGLSVALAQTVSTETRLQLSPAQKEQIYKSLSAHGSAPKTQTPEPGMRVVVGSSLPASVELRDMPPDMLADLPVMTKYKFVMVGGDVVIVDPHSRQVVEVLRN